MSLNGPLIGLVHSIIEDPPNLTSHHLHGSYLIIYLNQTPMFKWCMIKWTLRTDTQQDMCLEDI